MKRRISQLLTLTVVLSMILSTVAIVPMTASATTASEVDFQTTEYASPVSYAKDTKVFIKSGSTTTDVGTAVSCRKNAAANSVAADWATASAAVNAKGDYILKDGIAYPTVGMVPSETDASKNISDSQYWEAYSKSDRATEYEYKLSGKFIKGIAFSGIGHYPNTKGVGAKLLLGDGTYTNDGSCATAPTYMYSSSASTLFTAKALTYSAPNFTVNTTDFNIPVSTVMFDTTQPATALYFHTGVTNSLEGSKPHSIPATISGAICGISGQSVDHAGTFFAMTGLYEIEYSFDELVPFINERIADFYNLNDIEKKVKLFTAVKLTVDSAVERGFSSSTITNYEQFIIDGNNSANPPLEVIEKDIDNIDPLTGFNITFNTSIKNKDKLIKALSFKDSDGNIVSPTSVVFDATDKIATITCDDMKLSTQYSAKIDNTLLNFKGNSFENGSYEYQLTTKDNGPIYVNVDAPINGATNVDILTKDIVFNFTTKITPEEFGENFILLRNGEPYTAYVVTADETNRIITVTFDTEFGSNFNYTYTINKDIEDKCGRKLVEDYTGGFTTAIVPCVATLVTDLSTCTKLTNSFEFSFTTKVNKDDFAKAFLLKRNGVAVSDYTIQTTNNDYNVVVKLAGQLDSGNSYIINLSEDMTDNYGQKNTHSIFETLTTPIVEESPKKILNIDFEKDEDLDLFTIDKIATVPAEIVVDPKDETNHAIKFTSEAKGKQGSLIYNLPITDNYTKGDTIHISYRYLWLNDSDNTTGGHSSIVMSPKSTNGNYFYKYYFAGQSELRIMETSANPELAAHRIDNLATNGNSKWTTVDTIVDTDKMTMQYSVDGSTYKTTYIKNNTSEAVDALTVVMEPAPAEDLIGEPCKILFDDIKLSRIPQVAMFPGADTNFSDISTTQDINVRFSLPLSTKDNNQDKIKITNNGEEIANEYTVTLAEDGSEANIKIQGELEYNTVYAIKLLKGVSTTQEYGVITESDKEIAFRTTVARSINIANSLTTSYDGGSLATSQNITGNFVISNPEATALNVVVMFSAYGENNELLKTDGLSVTVDAGHSDPMSIVLNNVPIGTKLVKAFIYDTDFRPYQMPEEK